MRTVDEIIKNGEAIYESMRDQEHEPNWREQLLFEACGILKKQRDSVPGLLGGGCVKELRTLIANAMFEEKATGYLLYDEDIEHLRGACFVIEQLATGNEYLKKAIINYETELKTASACLAEYDHLGEWLRDQVTAEKWTEKKLGVAKDIIDRLQAENEELKKPL